MGMAINVAGTNALGDYLVSEIANVRTLMGLAPQANPAPVTAAPPDSTSGIPAAPAKTDYAADALAQQVANTQTLFGIQSTSDSGANLPPLASETPQQIAFVAIQESYIASEFSNTATLFGSLGLGTNTNTNA
jgi:hypothetical protein